MFTRLLYRNYGSLGGLGFRFGRPVTKLGWIVVVCIFIAAALGVDTNQSVAYQTSSFLICLMGAAFVTSRFIRTKVSAERLLPKFGSAGEPLRYSVLIKNETARLQRGLTLLERIPDPRPTYEEFANTPEPGEEKRNAVDRTLRYYRWQWLVDKNKRASFEEQTVPDLPPRNIVETRVELMPLKRGYLRLSGMTIATLDPFGLFRSVKTLTKEDSVLILPRRYKLPPLALPGASKFQQGGVSMASSIGESEEFVSLRDYRAGDPLRHIHWKSFAKTGKPVVKEFQDEFFVRHALILDTFDAPFHSQLFEEAVSVAASFAYTIQTQDSLLDLMFVGPLAYCFTAGRGVGQTEQMLEILAAVQPCHSQKFSTLKQLVVEHIGAVSGCICILVAWDEERQSLVEHLKVLGIPTMVLILSDEETALSPGPLSDKPEWFRVLPVQRVGEELAKL